MRMRHLPDHEIQKRVRQLMHQFGIEHIASRAPLTLSGGEQQRVAFARALANDRSDQRRRAAACGNRTGACNRTRTPPP
jgi:ABC-type polar amino acid transport system ATPase subunit